MTFNLLADLLDSVFGELPRDDDGKFRSSLLLLGVEAMEWRLKSIIDLTKDRGDFRTSPSCDISILDLRTPKF
jgi:hypothetical protein